MRLSLFLLVCTFQIFAIEIPPSWLMHKLSYHRKASVEEIEKKSKLYPTIPRLKTLDKAFKDQDPPYLISIMAKKELYQKHKETFFKIHQKYEDKFNQLSKISNLDLVTSIDKNIYDVMEYWELMLHYLIKLKSSNDKKKITSLFEKNWYIINIATTEESLSMAISLYNLLYFLEFTPPKKQQLNKNAIKSLYRKIAIINYWKRAEKIKSFYDETSEYYLWQGLNKKEISKFSDIKLLNQWNLDLTKNLLLYLKENKEFIDLPSWYIPFNREKLLSQLDYLPGSRKTKYNKTEKMKLLLLLNNEFYQLGSSIFIHESINQESILDKKIKLSLILKTFEGAIQSFED